MLYYRIVLALLFLVGFTNVCVRAQTPGAAVSYYERGVRKLQQGQTGPGH
jgi:hypothetical protein